MLSADDNKPTGKSGQRNRKKKSGQRTKSGQQRATGMDQLQHAPAETSRESVQETVQETIQETVQEAIHEIAEEIGQRTPQETGQHISPPVSSTEEAPGEASGMEIAASAPVELAPASTQAIADVYSDYARRSLEHAWTFLGKLATARSPVEAFELQMEFAKQAYESFVTESQKVADLSEQLTRQRAIHFEGFVARLTQTTFEIRTTRH